MNYPDARRRALDEQEEDVVIIASAVVLIVIVVMLTIFFISNNSSHSRPARKPTARVTQSQQPRTSHTSIMSINPGGPVRGLKTHP